MSTTKRPDPSNIDAALRAAGKRALWLGKRLGTPVVVFRDGKIVDAAQIDPEPTQQQAEPSHQRDS